MQGSSSMQITVEPSMTIRLPDAFDEFIRKAKADGQKLDITVDIHREKRSLEQNAYYHVLLRRLSYASGGTEEELDEMVKQKAVTMGYPFVYGENGKMEPKPSRSVNVNQMMILIEACIALGLDNGIELEE